MGQQYSPMIINKLFNPDCSIFFFFAELHIKKPLASVAWLKNGPMRVKVLSHISSAGT